MSDSLRFSDQPDPRRRPDAPSTEPDDVRSFGKVVMDAVANIQDIIRSEFRLATTELMEDLGRLGRGAALAGGAAIAFLLAAALVLAAVVFALATVLPLWASALIVAVLTGIVGIALLAIGVRQIRHASLKPVKTIDSIKETAEWAKDRTR